MLVPSAENDSVGGGGVGESSFSFSVSYWLLYHIYMAAMFL